MIPIVTPVIVRQRECPKCGYQVGQGYSACPQCGATLPKPASSNRLVVLGLVLALVLGVAVALSYV